MSETTRTAPEVDAVETTTAVVAGGGTPTASLPGESATNAGRRFGELVDRVLTGEHVAVIRNGRRPAVLVNSTWYDRQPGSTPNLVSLQTSDGRPITRAAYVEAVGERAKTTRTDPIQLDAVEAEFVAELLGELAAVYGLADPVGGLAHDCARMIDLRRGRES